MNLTKKDPSKEPYNPIKGLVDPKWDRKELPSVGQVWVVRSSDGSDIPLLCIALEVTEEITTQYLMKPGEVEVIGTSHPKIIVACVKIINELDFAMRIKKTNKGTFFDKKRIQLIKNVSTSDGYNIREKNEKVKFFCIKAFSSAYLSGNIASQHAYPLNPALSEKWMAEYVKFKMLLGIKGFHKPDSIVNPFNGPVTEGYFL